MNILRPTSELNFQNHFRFPSLSPTDFLEPRNLLREIMRRHAQTFFYHSQSEDEYSSSSENDYESTSENSEPSEQNEHIDPPMTSPALEQLPPLFPEYLGNLMPSIPIMSMPTILSINEQFHPVDLSANINEITTNDQLIIDEDNNDSESDDLENTVDPTDIFFPNYVANDENVPIDLRTNISEIATASSDDEEADEIPDQYHEMETENYAIAPDLFELPMVNYSPMLENDRYEYSPFRPYESNLKSYEPSQTQLFPEIDSAYGFGCVFMNVYAYGHIHVD